MKPISKITQPTIAGDDNMYQLNFYFTDSILPFKTMPMNLQELRIWLRNQVKVLDCHIIRKTENCYQIKSNGTHDLIASAEFQEVI